MYKRVTLRLITTFGALVPWAKSTSNFKIKMLSAGKLVMPNSSYLLNYHDGAYQISERIYQIINFGVKVLKVGILMPNLGNIHR